MNDHEEWRPIPGWPGYEASSLGRLRSILVGGHRDTSTSPHLLNPRSESNGRRRLNLFQNGRQKRCSVARMVCIAFHGLPTGSDACAEHIDGDLANDRADNLRWVPRAKRYDNPHVRAANFRAHSSVWLSGMNALPALVVDRIRRMYRMGHRIEEIKTILSKDGYEVSRGHISALACHDTSRPGVTEPVCGARGAGSESRRIRPGLKYGDSVVVRCLERYAAGQSARAIAKIEGIKRGTVESWLCNNAGSFASRQNVAPVLRASIAAFPLAKYEKVCPSCGVYFEAESHRARRCPLCVSDNPKSHARICPDCGGESHRRGRCKSCQRKRRRDYMQKYLREYKRRDRKSHSA
jgi:hypothetical protein